ncbi:MAG: NAD(P)H-hydrate dehydratase [Rhodopirellula sp.]|nr:NAD(P)H-hydrate dehydratase [Rhodopirellula sp.]
MQIEETTLRNLPLLAEREPESHKGTFGTALILGGSRGMTGAVTLAGMAALRGGAGLVRLAVADVCLDTVAGGEPSYMTTPLPCDRRGRIAFSAKAAILRAAAPATAVAVGPGLGRSLGLDALVAKLYTTLDQPVVIDADGLNALATRPEILSRPGGPRILTPHPGEFARLIGAERAPPLEERERLAIELAARCGVVVVLKSHRTLVTDGRLAARNTTGNAGMASGGSGDVLTGLIVSLLCQKLAPIDAARLGVFLHGLAGDLAAAQRGQEALVAGDLVSYLPQAFASVGKARHDRE